MHDRNYVFRIAKRVRRSVEKLAKYEEQRGFSGPNDTVNLAGYCSRAAAMLSNALAGEGIDHKIILAPSHVFVLWRKYIVDVTATQFGKDKVYMAPLKEECGYFWRVNIILNNSQELCAYQKEWYFPPEQSIRSYDMDFYKKRNDKREKKND